MKLSGQLGLAEAIAFMHCATSTCTLDFNLNSREIFALFHLRKYLGFMLLNPTENK